MLIPRRRSLGVNLDGRSYVLELDVAGFPIEAVEAVVVEEEAVAIEVVEVPLLTELRELKLVLGVAAPLPFGRSPPVG